MNFANHLPWRSCFSDTKRGFVDLAISQHPEFGQYHAQMHVLYVHCLPAQTEFTATVTQLLSIRQMMQNGDNYLKDGQIIIIIIINYY